MLPVSPQLLGAPSLHSPLWVRVGGPLQQHPKVRVHPQGPMAVVVTYGGDQIPRSPFPVTVAPPLQLGKVKVQGLNSSEWGAPGSGGAPWGGERLGGGRSMGSGTLGG